MSAAIGETRRAEGNVIALWSFGAATLGALAYQGGLDSGGLLLWAGASLTFLVALSLSCQSAGWRVDRLGALLLVELLWIVALQWFSVLPGAGFYSALVLAALPVTYLLLRTAGKVVAGDDLHIVLRALSMPVLLLAVVEILLTRRRAMSIFEDANLLAAFSILLFFPAWAQWLRARQSGRTAPLSVVVTVILAVLSLAATCSASGSLCFVAALVLFTVASVCVTRSPLWMAAAVLVLFGLASALAYRLDDSRVQPFARIAAEVRSGGNASGGGVPFFKERRAMVESALRIYADHHWYGTGPGTFRVLYPAYRSTADVSTAGNSVHNDYIQALLEGGPLLLLALLACLGATLAGVLASAKQLREPAGEAGGALERLGLSAALLAVMVQAASTFIFSTLTLSFFIGSYLGLLRRDIPGRSLALDELVSSRLNAMIFVLSGLLLGATLGLRTAFVSLSDKDGCGLQVCRVLRADSGFMIRFANLLAATQPSWFYSRLYLAKVHVDSARASHAEAERERFAELAALDLAKLAIDYPVLSEPYVRLADIVLNFPAAIRVLPPGVPKNREALELLALRIDPFDFLSATAAAREMVKRGANQEALQLLVDAAGHMEVNSGTVAARLSLLQIALPLALSLGRCAEAKTFASLIVGYSPGDTNAAVVLSAVSDHASAEPAVPGCGVSSLQMAPS